MQNAHSRKSYRPGTTLDAINERLVAEGKQLHPTKGFRRVSEKRSVASQIVALIKSGHRGWSTSTIASTLKDD